jgi:hypothetical protein
MTALSVYTFMVSYSENRTEKKLPQFSSVGAYTICYYTNGGSTLCAKCATETIIEWHDDPEGTYDPPTMYDTYDEGPTIQCDGCSDSIESSYGDPDADKLDSNEWLTDSEDNDSE